MYWGIYCIIAGILLRIVSNHLTMSYIEKWAPGLLDIDATLPPPAHNERYFWEMTAGTGIVPKWVSILGLLSYPTFVVGIVATIWHYLF